MLTIELSGLERALARTRNLPKQVRFAASRALNDAAFAARDKVVAEMAARFDRPKPWTLKSIWVGKKARPDSLEAWIYPRDLGGKSIDPTDVLRASVFGGKRKFKRFERAFQRVGILPQGFIMQPAPWLRESAVGDGHGGIKGSFIVRLLSYFQAFGEQGYRANMKAKGIARLAKRGVTDKGYKTIRGVEYFVSRGKGEFTGRGSWKNGQQQHLPAGIWQRSGIHGSDVKPVFYFQPMPTYSIRLPMGQLIADEVKAVLPVRMKQQLERALATAR